MRANSRFGHGGVTPLRLQSARARQLKILNMTPSEASRRFFQGAMAILVSAPEFKGSSPGMSLNEWFDAHLREPLIVVARKRGPQDYIGLLGGKVETAYRQYSEGNAEAARKTMVALLDLVHKHLHLPSKRQLGELAVESKVRG